MGAASRTWGTGAASTARTWSGKIAWRYDTRRTRLPIGDLASTRAHDLGTLALGLLESVGPAAVRLSVYRGLVRAVVWLDVATDDALEVVAEDRGLGERVIVVPASRDLWYRRASGRWPTLWMVARGPNHEGPPPHA